MKRIPILEPYDEVQCEQIANIFGESSASAKALKALERRRMLGENVGVFLDRRTRTIVVGPVVLIGQQEVVVLDKGEGR